MKYRVETITDNLEVYEVEAGSEEEALEIYGQDGDIVSESYDNNRVLEITRIK